MAQRPCVACLCPCYGGLIYYQFAISLMATKEYLNSRGVDMDVRFLGSESLISRGRNNLIATAMADPRFTHFFFIDVDIEWRPADVYKLVTSGKGVIGAVYPKKCIFWSKILDKATREAAGINIDNISEEELKHKLLEYVVNYSSDTSIVNNLIKVRHIGTGFMMIQREVIEKMIQRFPETKYNDDIGMLTREQDQYAYALFDCVIENGHYLSEDYTFCARYISIGGSVYLDVSIPLNHIGTFKFEGSLFDRLNLKSLVQGQNQPMAPQSANPNAALLDACNARATPPSKQIVTPKLHTGEPAQITLQQKSSTQPPQQSQQQQAGGNRLKAPIPKTRKFIDTNVPICRALYDSSGWTHTKIRPNNAADIVTDENVRSKIDAFLTVLPEYPAQDFSGRGIVIVSGGVKYINNTYITMHILRNVHKCDLPVEWWYIGAAEMTPQIKADLESKFSNLTCRDLTQVTLHNGNQVLNVKGYEGKPLAILASRFQEVLLIDADNIPLKNPACLFEMEAYRENGNYFWSDFWRGTYDTALYTTLGLDNTPYENINDTESGQALINKAVSWKQLNLAWWMNNHSYYFYRYCWGDKDEYRLAWTFLRTHHASTTSQQFTQNKFTPQSIGRVNHEDKLFYGNNMVHFDDKREPTLLHLTLAKVNSDFDSWEMISKNVEFWAMSGAYLATDLEYDRNTFVPIPYPIQKNVLDVIKSMWKTPYIESL